MPGLSERLAALKAKQEAIDEKKEAEKKAKEKEARLGELGAEREAVLAEVKEAEKSYQEAQEAIKDADNFAQSIGEDLDPELKAELAAVKADAEKAINNFDSLKDKLEALEKEIAVIEGESLTDEKVEEKAAEVKKEKKDEVGEEKEETKLEEMSIDQLKEYLTEADKKSIEEKLPRGMTVEKLQDEIDEHDKKKKEIFEIYKKARELADNFNDKLNANHKDNVDEINKKIDDQVEFLKESYKSESSEEVASAIESSKKTVAQIEDHVNRYNHPSGSNRIALNNERKLVVDKIYDLLENVENVTKDKPVFKMRSLANDLNAYRNDIMKEMRKMEDLGVHKYRDIDLEEYLESQLKKQIKRANKIKETFKHPPYSKKE